MTHPQKYRALLAGDVARLLNIGPSTVKRMVQRGDIEPTWISSGRSIFAWGDLLVWAKRHGRTVQPLALLDDDDSYDEGDEADQ